MAARHQEGAHRLARHVVRRPRERLSIPRTAWPVQVRRMYRRPLMRTQSEPRRGLVLAGVMGSGFLPAMESTGGAAAMPTVIASPGGIEIYSWTFSAFLPPSPGTLPPLGRLPHP